VCGKTLSVLNPLFVAVDLAVAVVAVRSALLLRRRSPFSTVGWLLTIGFGLAAATEYGIPALHAVAGQVAHGFLVVLAVAFIIAGIRDEPQAEPLLWPVRIGPTRAERRAANRPPAP
jgi:hypothetical protein